MNDPKIKEYSIVAVKRDIEETKLIIKRLEDKVITRQRQIEKRFNRFVLTSLIIIVVLAIINIIIELFR